MSQLQKKPSTFQSLLQQGEQLEAEAKMQRKEVVNGFDFLPGPVMKKKKSFNDEGQNASNGDKLQSGGTNLNLSGADKNALAGRPRGASFKIGNTLNGETSQPHQQQLCGNHHAIIVENLAGEEGSNNNHNNNYNLNSNNEDEKYANSSTKYNTSSNTVAGMSVNTHPSNNNDNPANNNNSNHAVIVEELDSQQQRDHHQPLQRRGSRRKSVSIQQPDNNNNLGLASFGAVAATGSGGAAGYAAYEASCNFVHDGVDGEYDEDYEEDEEEEIQPMPLVQLPHMADLIPELNDDHEDYGDDYGDSPSTNSLTPRKNGTNNSRSSGNGESGSLDFGKRTPAENNGKKRKNSRSAHQDGDFDIEHAVSDDDDNDDDLNDNTDNNNNNNQQQPSLSGTSNQQKYGSFHFPDKQNSNNSNNNNKKNNNNGENNFHIPTGGSDVFENNNNNNSSDNDDSSPATRHQQFSRSNSDSSFQSESSGSVDVQQQENKSDKGGNNDDEENEEGDACCWCIPINRGAKYDTHARIVPVCSSTSVPFLGNQVDNDNTLQNNNRATTLQKTNSLQPVSKTGNKNTPHQKNIDAANQQQQQQQENTTQHPSREDGSFDEKGRKFGDNNVFTTKYSLHPWEVTKFFLTKMLWEQFQRKANIYFLVVGGIQLIPGLSPFGQYTTIMTLAVVLTFSMVKLGIEDFMRYKRDKSINTRTAYVLKSFDDKEWRKVTYADICVGDLVRVDNVLDENGHRNNEIPCDLILLSSSELEGVCYVETANLDGETNLKQRRALSSTVQHLDFGFAADAFLQAYRNMYVECEHPNGSLYTFTAKLEAPNAQLNNQSMSTPSASHITLGQQRSSLQLNGTNSFELSNSHLHQQQQNQRVSNSSNQMGVFTITPPVAAIRRESLNNNNNNSKNNSKDDQQQQEEKEKQNQASEVDQEVAEQEAQEKEEEEEKDQQQTWRALGEFKGKTAAAKKENSSIGMNDSINGPPPGFNRSARRGSTSVCSTGTAKPGDVVAGSKPDDAKTTTTAPPSGQHQISNNSLGTDNHIINNTNFSGVLKSGNIGNNNNTNNNNNSTLNSLLDALQQHQRKRFRPKFDALPATGNTASVSLTQSLYRGCSLRKALWAVGVCVSTGHETKIMKNARNPPHKHSRVERMVNVLLIAVLGLQLALTIAATVCVSLIPFKGWYFPDDAEGASIVLEVLKNFATFIILFNNFVPISLYVSIEFIKFGQGRLLEQDLCMYYPPKDMPASAKTTDLNEELGQINFVFCDKTGTLTRNVMALLKFSVNNSIYGEGTTEIGRVAALRKGVEIDDPRPQSVIQSPDPFWDRRLGEKWFMDRNVAKIRELFMALGVCHTVVVDGKKLEAESPDDEALVKAAARFDYELVGRSLEGVTLMAKNAGQTFIRVVETLPFNSVRKRMSVVIRDPTTSKYVLVTKGADTVMLPRMNRKQGNLKHTQGILNKFAEEGLRTLVVCSRELNDDYIEGWLGKIKAAREMIGREKERDQIIDNLAEEIEKDLILIGVTGVEDKLQDRVSQTISALRTAGMNVWMLTGDKRETATNIGFACALLHGDMETVTLHSMKKNDAPVLLTKLQEAVRRKLQCEADWDKEQEEKKKNGDFGILTSAGASRVLGENSAVEMKPIHQRRVHVNKFDDDITAVTTSAAKSVKKKNPNNNSDAKDGNNPRNSKSKDQRQQVSSPTAAAASAAASAATVSENKNKNEQQDDEEKIYRPINSEIRQKFASGFNRGKEFCCVIDGGTLALALATPQLREAFYELVSRCSSVICCRVSPKQKADVVTMMREYSHDAITTLAIGDGANDVPMIQAAHVGVGISGMEGQQAANSADFAIGQFKHLHRLVLVHGSANYQRISTVIKYSFYKNAILVMTLFFFLIYNAFTGQSLYEEWSFASYNVIFTFFPVLIVGIFDREIFNTDHFHDFPQLYKAGISNLHLNTPIMIWWLLVAILQGLVIFFVIIVSPEDCIGKKGIPLALDGQGIAAYGAVVLVATIQLCFMIQSYGNMQYTAIGGSLLAFFTFLAVYSAFPATVSTTLYGILVNAAFEQIMWLLAVLALVMAILPTLLVRYFQRTLTPVVDLPIAEIVQLADQDDRDAAIIAPMEVFEEDYSADNGDAANRLSEADKFRHSTLTFLLSGTSRNKDELKINDEQDWLLRFVDDEVEEAFHQKYVGDMFRYRVGFGVCSIASIAVAANFLRLSGSVSLVETAGWVIFAFASVFGFFVIQFFPESRSHLNEIMVLLMTIAFSGASIANLIATDSDRQTHPVTLAVILLGLLVLVRPVLLQAIAYMIIVICVYFMWSLIWIQNWSSRDESMRAAELLIVGVTSIIGLAMTEDFHRKMFISRMSIVRALTTAREEQKRSLLLLQNVMPASIVADLRGKTLGQFSLSFERASIVTSDVVKFTNFSAGHESHVVVEMLNIMFVMFDAHASELGIEKIKTIGDAYMCASGIPCVDPDHARKIMIMGLWMLRSVALMCREGTPSIRKLDISVRVGAATGRVQAGVVGRQKLCYDVFGPAVKEATLMESTSRPRRLRVTPALYELTKNIFTYEIVQVDPRERDPESVDAVETVYFAYDDRKDKEWLLASKGNKINITKGGSKKRRRAAYRPYDTREDQYQFLTRGNKSAQTFLQVYRLDEGVMSPYTLNFESGLIENDFRNYLSSLADARTKSERKQAFALFLLCSLLLALYFRTFVHWLVLVLFSLAWVAMFSLLILRTEVNEFEENMEKTGGLDRIIQGTSSDGLSDAGANKDKKDNDSDNVSQQAFNMSYQHNPAQGVAGAGASMTAPSPPGSTNDLLKSKKGSRTSSGHGSGNTTRRSSEALDVAAAGTVGGGGGGAAVDDRETTGTESAAQFMQAMNFKRTNSGAKSALSAEESPNSSLPARMTSNPASHENLQSLFLLQNNNNNANPNQQKKASNFENHQKYGESAFFKDDDDGNRRGSTNQSSDNHHDGTSLKVENVSQESSSGENTTNNTGNKNENNRHTKSNDDRATPAGTFAGFSSGKSEINNTNNNNNNNNHPQKNGAASPYNYNEDPNIQWVASYFESSPEQANLQHKKISNMAAYKTPGQTNNNNNQPLNFNTATTTSMTTTTTTANTTSTTSQTHLLINADGTVASANPSVPFGSFPNNNAQIQQRNHKNQLQPSAVAVAMSTTPSSNAVTTDDQASSPRDHQPPPSSNLAHQQSGLVSIVSPNENPLNHAPSNQHGGGANNDDHRPPSPTGYGSIKKRQSIVQITSPSEQQLPRPNINSTSANRAGPLVVAGGSAGGGIEKYDASCASVPLGLRTAPPSNQQTPAGSVTAHPMGNNNNNNNLHNINNNISSGSHVANGGGGHINNSTTAHPNSISVTEQQQQQQPQQPQHEPHNHQDHASGGGIGVGGGGAASANLFPQSLSNVPSNRQTPSGTPGHEHLSRVHSNQQTSSASSQGDPNLYLPYYAQHRASNQANTALGKNASSNSSEVSPTQSCGNVKRLTAAGTAGDSSAENAHHLAGTPSGKSLEASLNINHHQNLHPSATNTGKNDVSGSPLLSATHGGISNNHNKYSSGKSLNSSHPSPNAPPLLTNQSFGGAPAASFTNGVSLSAHPEERKRQQQSLEERALKLREESERKKGTVCSLHLFLVGISVAIGFVALAMPALFVGLEIGKEQSTIGVFLCLAAIVNVASSTRLRLWHKIVFSVIHSTLFIALYLRNTSTSSANGSILGNSDDAGNLIAVLLCYAIAIYAGYTSEVSIRENFSAGMRVQIENNQVTAAVNLCERLLNNVLPQTIIERMRKNPSKRIVDEVDDASVLFLYVNGLKPDDQPHLELSTHPASINPGVLGASSNSTINHNNQRGTPESLPLIGIAPDADQLVQQRVSTQQLIHEMNDFVFVVDLLCQYHRVEKIKTVPFLIASGCPTPCGNHSIRLACLARDVIRFAQFHNQRTSRNVVVKAGLHSGKVSAGVLGSIKFIYDVFGDTVNVASRLASVCQAGRVCLSDVSAERIAEYGRAFDAGSHELKGKGLQHLWYLDPFSLHFVPSPPFVEEEMSMLAAQDWVDAHVKDPHESTEEVIERDEIIDSDALSKMDGRASLVSSNTKLGGSSHLGTDHAPGLIFNNNNNSNNNNAPISPLLPRRTRGGQTVGIYNNPEEEFWNGTESGGNINNAKNSPEKATSNSPILQLNNNINNSNTTSTSQSSQQLQNRDSISGGVNELLRNRNNNNMGQPLNVSTSSTSAENRQSQQKSNPSIHTFYQADNGSEINDYPDNTKGQNYLNNNRVVGSKEDDDTSANHNNNINNTNNTEDDDEPQSAYQRLIGGMKTEKNIAKKTSNQGKMKRTATNSNSNPQNMNSQGESEGFVRKVSSGTQGSK